MTDVYPASPIKRIRATKVEMSSRRQELHDIVKAMWPMTVRQVYYQATVRHIVDKTEGGYSKVQTDLVEMRRSGMLPFGWIVDNTRLMRKPTSYSGIEHALEATARLYRSDLWRDADAYVEVWLEKDALSGVIYPVTAEYDVPLMVARGYASPSYSPGGTDVVGGCRVSC